MASPPKIKPPSLRWVFKNILLFYKKRFCYKNIQKQFSTYISGIKHINFGTLRTWQIYVYFYFILSLNQLRQKGHSTHFYADHHIMACNQTIIIRDATWTHNSSSLNKGWGQNKALNYILEINSNKSF